MAKRKTQEEIRRVQKTVQKRRERAALQARPIKCRQFKVKEAKRKQIARAAQKEKDAALQGQVRRLSAKVQKLEQELAAARRGQQCMLARVRRSKKVVDDALEHMKKTLKNARADATNWKGFWCGLPKNLRVQALRDHRRRHAWSREWTRAGVWDPALDGKGAVR